MDPDIANSKPMTFDDKKHLEIIGLLTLMEFPAHLVDPIVEYIREKNLRKQSDCGEQETDPPTFV